jgi:hypothetical protein
MLCILAFFGVAFVDFLFLVEMLRFDAYLFFNEVLEGTRLVVFLAGSSRKVSQFLFPVLPLTFHDLLVFAFMLFNILKVDVFLPFKGNFYFFFFAFLLQLHCPILLI